MKNNKHWLQVFASILLIYGLSACGSKTETAESTPKTEASEVEQKVSENKSVETEKTILFFGNSLTAGYGLDLSNSFPSLIQRKLDSLGYNYKVINAGLSGETTSGGNGRVEWVMKQQVDVFVLELGGNDGLRGIPLSETKANLQRIIDKVKKISPDIQIVLAGMQIPPNMGKEYITTFQEIYPAMAEKNSLPLIPFLLAGVAGDPELNLDDGIHPNEEGQVIVAETVWKYLEPLLEK